MCFFWGGAPNNPTYDRCPPVKPLRIIDADLFTTLQQNHRIGRQALCTKNLPTTICWLKAGMSTVGT